MFTEEVALAAMRAHAAGESVDTRLLTETLELTADTNWTGSFTELDKYADGQEITYTVDEVSIKGYNTVITGTQAEGFVVTNSHSVSPKTGDHMDSMLWLMVMLGSAAAFAATALYTKKRYAQ